jgi:glycosyltransferase involved in cell wall biosynthesis
MISFIVPAHNEEHVIGSTLASIHVAAREARRQYEIVVVDDSSTDSTAAVAIRHDARVVSVKCRQIAAARNTGAREAAGDVLIFVDADTLVSGRTLLATLRALEGGAAGGGAMFVLEGRIPLHGRALVRLVRASMRVGRLAAGCYLFCTRDAFARAGGFDERLFATEEIALSRALKRHGPVVILDETVETSGRKLRTHSAWDLVRLLAAYLTSGGRALRSRTHLDIWYGRRRVDPDTRL